MSLLDFIREPENRSARMFVAAAALPVFLTAIAVGVPAGAQEECAAEITFDQVHLLNNGVDMTAGPFPVELEAGTYTIVVESYDNHDDQVELGIGTQPDERFHLVLDSGYRSAATNDIADDENTVTTVFTCLLYTSPSPRDRQKSRMPSSA